MKKMPNFGDTKLANFGEIQNHLIQVEPPKQGRLARERGVALAPLNIEEARATSDVAV